MSRTAITVALSATLLSLAAVNAAATPTISPPGATDGDIIPAANNNLIPKKPVGPARPGIKIACGANYQGRNPTLTNNSGAHIPRGSRVIIYYFVAGKFDRKETFTLVDEFPAGTSEIMSYAGGPVSSCIALVKFPPPRS